MNSEKRLPVPRRTGLSAAQAAEKLREIGRNELQGKKKIRPVLLFFSQFKDILTLILVLSKIGRAHV